MKPVLLSVKYGWTFVALYGRKWLMFPTFMVASGGGPPSVLSVPASTGGVVAVAVAVPVGDAVPASSSSSSSSSPQPMRAAAPSATPPMAASLRKRLRGIEPQPVLSCTALPLTFNSRAAFWRLLASRGPVFLGPYTYANWCTDSYAVGFPPNWDSAGVRQPYSTYTIAINTRTPSERKRAPSSIPLLLARADVVKRERVLGCGPVEPDAGRDVGSVGFRDHGAWRPAI